MTQMNIQAPVRNARGGYKVDVSRGQRIGRESLAIEDGRVELRTVTGPDYGRYLNSQAVSPAIY